MSTHPCITPRASTHAQVPYGNWGEERHETLGEFAKTPAIHTPVHDGAETVSCPAIRPSLMDSGADRLEVSWANRNIHVEFLHAIFIRL